MHLAPAQNSSFLIFLELFFCAINSSATCKITIGVAPEATDPTFSENCALGAAALLRCFLYILALPLVWFPLRTALRGPIRDDWTFSFYRGRHVMVIRVLRRELFAWAARLHLHHVVLRVWLGEQTLRLLGGIEFARLVFLFIRLFQYHLMPWLLSFLRLGRGEVHGILLHAVLHFDEGDALIIRLQVRLISILVNFL